MPPDIKYRVSNLSITPEMRAATAAVIASGNLTQGEVVDRLERDVESRLGTADLPVHAVACNSGTSALHLSLLALGIGEGDYVLMPSFTYVAVRNAVLYVGATPVYCDVDPYTFTISRATIKQAVDDMAWDIAAKIKAVILVHMYSALVDVEGCMAAIYDGLDEPAIIVDASHIAPVRLNNDPPPDYERLIAATTYSFYASKIVGAGEGGMVVFSDEYAAERARLYRGQGTTRGSYDHLVVGYNYRMTDVTAALVIEQLSTVGWMCQYRSDLHGAYYEELAMNGVLVQSPSPPYYCWMVAMLLPMSVPVDEFRRRMLEYGVETRQFFTPMHLLFDEAGDVAGEVVTSLINSEQIYERGVCLPTHTGISGQDARAIVEILVDSIQDIRRGKGRGGN